MKVSPEVDSAIQLTVNLNGDAARVLKAISEKHKITLTEAVRQAIVFLRFMDQMHSQGRRVQVVNGSIIQDIQFLWEKS